MNRKTPILLLFFLLPAMLTAQEEEAELRWDTALRTALDRFVPELDGATFNTGIQVYDLTADSVLWNYNPDKVMRPASCQKLLTAIAALDLLGAGHSVTTRAYYSGSISDSVLQGNIYIAGGFDPTYTYEDLRQLAAEIRSLGFTSIRGRILADVSFKDTLRLGSGWCWDDEPSAFSPFLSPLLFDRGRLTPHSERYPKDIFFNPAEHFLKTLCTELGLLPDTGSYGFARVPQHPRLFYKRESSVADLLTRTLKNSDNLYAEALFYQIAHWGTGAGATAADAARLVSNVVRRAGANSTLCAVRDGSGLSPYNFVSPRCLVALLRYAYAREAIRLPLWEALPTAGLDGTLEKRMTTGPAHLNVHAKTGTVTGVSALSGYVTASNGHTLAFAIINNGMLKTVAAQNLQDRICQELAR